MKTVFFVMISMMLMPCLNGQALSFSKLEYEKEKVIEGVEIQGLGIMDCHNLTFRDCDISEYIVLDDSYPKIGLKNIKFDNCYIHDNTKKRLIFLGGHNVKNITFNDCVITRCIGETHLVYMSGGHWDPDYNPISNIKFISCNLSIAPGGRNVLQFNGRFKDITIDNCTFSHAEMNGLNFIGCQDVTVTNCTFYGSNRSCIGIYNYIDGSYWDDKNPKNGTVAEWKKIHHKNKNYTIKNNVMIVGPYQFHWDDWHNNIPNSHQPVLFIQNNIPIPGYASENITISNNIICTPNIEILQISNNEEAIGVTFTDNIVWSPRWKEMIHNQYKAINFIKSLKSIKKIHILDPKFDYWPIYPHEKPYSPKASDRDWSKFKSKFNSSSKIGKKMGIGLKASGTGIGD